MWNFTATATDADLPDDVLAFSLVNAPSGMSINGATGVIAWTPKVEGTTTFDIKVTDRYGKSDQKTFTLTVQSDPNAPARLIITDVTLQRMNATTVTVSFNVGTRLSLTDFTLAQVAELNIRYGSPLPDTHAARRLYALLNGHPYLTRRALSEMQAHGLDAATLEAQADRSEGVFGDHLRRLLVSLTHNPELTEVVRALLIGQSCPSEKSFFRLRSAGLLAGETPDKWRWRCSIYADYLKRHLK